MNRRITMFLGVTIGGFVGWIIGSIAADYFAPEYYTDEELLEMQQILENTEYVPTKEITYKLVEQEEKEPSTRRLVSYHEMYNKPDLASLIPIQEEDMDEEDDDWEEDPLAGIPTIDYEDLSHTPTDVFIAERDETEPYILTEDEWEANEEPTNRRALLKYFEEDDVLTDEKNRPLESVDRVVGHYALSNFGVYSMNSDTVYVRNPELGSEYTVIKIEGSYVDAVLRPDKKDVLEVRNVFDDEFEEFDDSSEVRHTFESDEFDDSSTKHS